MKNRNFKLAMLIFSCLLFASCAKIRQDNLETMCEAKGEAISTTGTAFFSTMNSTTCQDYKDAIEDYFTNCQSYQHYNPAFQESLADWDCSDYDE